MDPNQIAQLAGVVLSNVQQATAPASPGWKTSEFWLHLVSQIPTVLAVCLGASNPITIGIGAIAMIGSSVYSASRAHVKAAAVVAQAPAVAKALSDALAAATSSSAQPGV